MFGRGSSDDKGPVLGWINVLEAVKACGGEVPVNLRFCLEGMEESGSEGLDDLIEREKDGWFKSVDCVCISGESHADLAHTYDQSGELILTSTMGRN